MSREQLPGKKMDARYEIHPARPSELAALREIEDEAATLFSDTPYADAVSGDATSMEDFAEAQRAGRLWVAATREGVPVAFAFVESVGACAHLDELDVHPTHGRRGIGAALVREVCRWAHDQGLPAVTLTTFRDVPWNAPFYARMGFAPVPEDRLTPEQRALFEHENRMGLRSDARFFMRCDLDLG